MSMSFKKILCFVLVSYLGFSECSFVDTLNKCGLNEYDCQAKNVQDVMHTIGKHGIKELNIPSIDPVKLSNVDVSVAELINITLVEGVAEGAKDFIIKKYITDFDKRVVSVELIGNITIRGQYKMHSSAAIEQLFGGRKPRGEGNGKIKIVQLKLNMELSFKVVKRDGEIYIVLDKKYSYTFEVLGKVEFDADNLYLGNKESSKEIIALLNENWKTVVNSLGTKVCDVSMKYVYKFIQKFCYNVPAKHYVKEDLTPYVKKE